MAETKTSFTSKLGDIPRGIWALGLVSMFMDISSEMIHALLPIYMVTILGTSVLTVGFIEGLAEATASITKIFSGALSDWLGKRKLLAAIGYGLAAFTKPIFPLAQTVGWLVAARFIDRVGKGIRGAPRDALVADIAPPDLRGASFGLRQSLDTIGAFVGPLAAIALMTLSSDNFRFVFWIAVIPAFIAFALMVFGVDEPKKQQDQETNRAHLSRRGQIASGLLGSRRRCFRAHACKVLGSLSHSAVAERWASHSPCAADHGGDEHCLCACGLPCWGDGRQDRTARRSDCGHCIPDCCRHHSCDGVHRLADYAGGCLLGTSHGVHARTACNAGGGYGSR